MVGAVSANGSISLPGSAGKALVGIRIATSACTRTLDPVPDRFFIVPFEHRESSQNDGSASSRVFP